MHIVHVEHIKRSAAAAADQQLGLSANPYPDGSAAHAAWLQAYADYIREASMEVAQ